MGMWAWAPSAAVSALGNVLAKSFFQADATVATAAARYAYQGGDPLAMQILENVVRKFAPVGNPATWFNSLAHRNPTL